MDDLKSIDPPVNTPSYDLFSIRQTTPQEVLKKIKPLRLDTTTGPDVIPAKFLTPVNESPAGPLTNVINSFIKIMDFPKIWKQARITPIPKVTNPTSNNDYRPIGQFQKISIPNHGRLPCFNPPLPSEIPKCVTPPCPQNSIMVNRPPPLKNFRVF